MSDFAVNINNLTSNTAVSNNTVTGNGIFDKIMETLTKHIQAQFDANRIRSEDYADVYLGALQYALTTATQILLSKDITEQQAFTLESDRIIKEAQNTKDLALKDAQLVIAENEALTLESDRIIKEAQSAKDLILKDAQLVIAEKEALKLDKDMLKLDKDILRVDAEIDILVKNLDKADAEIAMLDKNLDKADAEISLAQAQESELLLNGTADRAIKAQQTTLTQKQILVEETKKLLLERQITGFNDDAKQKILKHCTDTWAVGYSVAKDEHSIPYLVNENTIDSIAKSILTDLSITVSNNPIVVTWNGV